MPARHRAARRRPVWSCRPATFDVAVRVRRRQIGRTSSVTHLFNAMAPFDHRSPGRSAQCSPTDGDRRRDLRRHPRRPGRRRDWRGGRSDPIACALVSDASPPSVPRSAGSDRRARGHPRRIGRPDRRRRARRKRARARPGGEESRGRSPAVHSPTPSPPSPATAGRSSGTPRSRSHPHRRPSRSHDRRSVGEPATDGDRRLDGMETDVI